MTISDQNSEVFEGGDSFKTLTIEEEIWYRMVKLSFAGNMHELAFGNIKL